MKGLRLCVAAAFMLIGFGVTAQDADAQVTINIGVAPVCPYGYFDYVPYGCAPFGYYGPEWFRGGVFVGSGPWFHGPVGFHGYINRVYDPRYGYHGPFPHHGEHADWGRHVGWEKHFHGSERREEYRHDNGNHYGQYKNQDHGNGHGHGHDDDHGHGRGHN